MAVQYGTEGLDLGHCIQELWQKPAPSISGSSASCKDMLYRIQRAITQETGRTVARLVLGKPFISEEIAGEKLKVNPEIFNIV